MSKQTPDEKKRDEILLRTYKRRPNLTKLRPSVSPIPSRPNSGLSAIRAANTSNDIGP